MLLAQIHKEQLLEDSQELDMAGVIVDQADRNTCGCDDVCDFSIELWSTARDTPLR